MAPTNGPGFPVREGRYLSCNVAAGGSKACQSGLSLPGASFDKAGLRIV
jgi:hypothetical protein